ncbi:hypothetical protein [Streptomyces sp. NPDC049881]|uniref:hypothetical protein n=1 Tax=Streptomyces sp. NPDC049881 TaxID=3155778 RepID=UPI003424A87F
MLPALVGIAAAGAAGETRAQDCAGAPAPQSSTRWTADQLRNATTIIDVARTRSLPTRAAVIAVATAIQESDLHILDHGDRDSVGLFQQRPSQGWGASSQLMDSVYSSGKFYDALLEVPDWESRPLTEVAQAVQRSALPDAYAKWEQAASTLVADIWEEAPAPACDGEPALDPAGDFNVDNPRSPGQAVAAARAAAGQTGWYRLCDRFVAEAYGYAYSGAETANVHWNQLHAAGLTHPGDDTPPVGALLFYETGEAAGHVALYLGNELVASNDVLDSFPGEGKIAIVHRHELTGDQWRLRYRGWAEPAFPQAGGTARI